MYSLGHGSGCIALVLVVGMAWTCPSCLSLVLGPASCLIYPVPCLELALYPLRWAWHPLFEGVFVRFPLGEMM